MSEPRPIMDIVRDTIPHVTGTDRDLLVRLLNGCGHDAPRGVRWSQIGATSGHGSGVSHALCRAVGLDPDERVGWEECVACGDRLYEDLPEGRCSDCERMMPDETEEAASAAEGER